MLKIAGCICILLASSGMAYTYIRGLKKELGQMEQLMELLTVVESEITYSRCPLPELLLHLSEHMPQPYHSLLKQCSYRMEDNKEADIPVLWNSICGEYKEQFVMPREACQLLLRMGEVFSYVSLESSLQLLQISRNRLAAFMEKGQAEFEGKRKLYCCLCYMAGLFSIILLL